jgi:hypothetical protein
MVSLTKWLDVKGKVMEVFFFTRRILSRAETGYVQRGVGNETG